MSRNALANASQRRDSWCPDNSLRAFLLPAKDVYIPLVLPPGYAHCLQINEQSQLAVKDRIFKIGLLVATSKEPQTRRRHELFHTCPLSQTLRRSSLRDALFASFPNDAIAPRWFCHHRTCSVKRTNTRFNNLKRCSSAEEPLLHRRDKGDQNVHGKPL